MIKTSAGFLALMALFTQVAAFGAEIKVISNTAGRPAIVSVSGDFVRDDHKVFINKTLNLNEAIIVFQSPGGNLIAGIEIGKAIRLKNFTTLVPSEAICASACALPWLGGTKRLRSKTALIGFHAAYSETQSGQTKESGLANAIVGAYLNSLGLPISAVVYITATAPNPHYS
jgi:hypothetical protein